MRHTSHITSTVEKSFVRRRRMLYRNKKEHLKQVKNSNSRIIVKNKMVKYTTTNNTMIPKASGLRITALHNYTPQITATSWLLHKTTFVQLSESNWHCLQKPSFGCHRYAHLSHGTKHKNVRLIACYVIGIPVTRVVRFQPNLPNVQDWRERKY